MARGSRRSCIWSLLNYEHGPPVRTSTRPHASSPSSQPAKRRRRKPSMGLVMLETAARCAQRSGSESSTHAVARCSIRGGAAALHLCLSTRREECGISIYGRRAGCRSRLCCTSLLEDEVPTLLFSNLLVLDLTSRRLLE